MKRTIYTDDDEKISVVIHWRNCNRHSQWASRGGEQIYGATCWDNAEGVIIEQQWIVGKANLQPTARAMAERAINCRNAA